VVISVVVRDDPAARVDGRPRCVPSRGAADGFGASKGG
jgi:hypothetical protein